VSFSKGDIVKFKDKVGSAVILKCFPDNTFEIESEEGFRYRCHQNELIKPVNFLKGTATSLGSPEKIKNIKVKGEPKTAAPNFFDKPSSKPKPYVSPEKLAEMIAARGIVDKDAFDKNEPKPVKEKKEKEPPSIDLHIYELIESESGLTNAQMVKIQLDAMDNFLKRAMKNRWKRVVVVHGKGQGVLRAEVRRFLAKNPEKFEFYDAPYEKWGMGATMVDIFGV
jgi:dsDNA-specific endonuclease/ATPase MutS2